MSLLPILDQPHPASPSAGCGSELPVFQEGELDWEALDCLLADLDDFAELVLLRAKDPSGAHRQPRDIVAARDGLVSGELAALQLVYHFADDTWSDTLVRTGGGARLLRLQGAMLPE